ncbi:MAG: alpha/beta hydrolase [Bacteroidetes bacterium]|nr:alpha/beta hydrolase [Bacteroidota bacterium]MBT4411380.1 alpha/beta hydrolase [Bacteroidota bacterium]
MKFSVAKVTDQNIPRMIVVGIENTDRDKNYTPTANSGIEHNFETAGEADQFLEFLEDELMPFLESRYRVASHRCIVGWSFSGLFATYSAIKKPDLFNFHLCISPAIWWDNELVYEEMQNISGFDQYKRIVFTLGKGEEGGYVFESTKRLLNRLQEDPIDRLSFQLLEFEGVGHSWGVSSAINKGLQTLYQEFIPPSDIISGQMNKLNEYYEKAE